MSERLREEAAGYSFFQVVQLLERYYRPEARIGRQGPSAREIIRFRPMASLVFPASDIAEIGISSEGDPPQTRFLITTTFLGLYGTVSPLPVFYTEEVIWADQEQNPVRAFMDMFHHRFLSLFYRCWLKYRYPVQFEEEGSDEFSQRMLGLIGLGTTGLAENAGVPPVRLIRYAGLLSQQPRSASALEGILSDFFDDIPVHIHQCAGRWVPIHPEQRMSLGRQNCRLGIDCSVGEKVFGRNGSFQIALGPMGYEAFVSFLPDGKRFKAVNGLVRFFVKDSLDFDIGLQIRGEEIPPLQLFSEEGMRLGWTSWLFSKSFQPSAVCSLRIAEC